MQWFPNSMISRLTAPRTWAVALLALSCGWASAQAVKAEPVPDDPAVKPADAPLPTALTPVYPTSAQLPQAYLRKVIASALPRAPHQAVSSGPWHRPSVPAR